MMADKGNQAVERVVAVVEFLAAGEIEAWKSVREVAAGAGLPVASCHGILETLATREWVDKGPKGYRLGSLKLIGMLLEVQHYFKQLLDGYI